MWDYTEKVKEHFYNPRNTGPLDGANATGDVGSISCGDALRLMLKVEPVTEVIQDAHFQTFGCGSAIASSSALTEMVKGKTLDEAMKISNQDIADFLDGLPPEKMHCSVMGREALHAAIANYRGEVWADDHEEGALVCKCFAVDSQMIEDTIRDNKLSTVEEVTNYTKAGGGCSTCHEPIEEILIKVMAERGETFVAAGAKKATQAIVHIEPATPAAPKLGMLARIRKIEEVIAAVRPTLLADRGDIELVDVDGKNIMINLTGACSGCQMEAATIAGIQTKMIEALGEFVRIVPVAKAKATACASGGK